MKSVSHNIKTVGLATLAGYVVVAGLFALAGLLQWAAWDLIGEWLLRLAIIGVIIVLIFAIVALLASKFRT